MKAKQIPDLVVNFDSDSPDDYVEVLNKVSEKMGSCIKNLGAFADITGVEVSPEMIGTFSDAYISTTVTEHECPGAHGDHLDDANSPEDLELDVLLANRDANDERLTHAASENGVPKGSHTILGGTVDVNSCDPQQDCPKCDGSGACAKCDGSGETQCTKCNGTGDCRKCHGTGVIICPRCKGGGYLKNGSKCDNCGGEGTIGCPDCKRFLFGSNGKCSKCQGSGTVECKECCGDGKCTNCNGTGRVVCCRCGGSGYYTAFSVCSAETINHSRNFYSREDIGEVHGKLEGDGECVFSGQVRKWKTCDELEFDRLDEICKAVGKAFQDPQSSEERLKDAYADNAQLLKEEAQGIHHSSEMSIMKIPTATIRYRVNDEDFTLKLIGHVAMAERLPKTIKEFKNSFFHRIFSSFTRKRRRMAFLKLAAYIFQKDGLVASESTTLACFVNAITRRESKQKKLYTVLERYGAEMQYEKLRGEIKILFASKKFLTFAWQCMAVDKEISQEDLKLFEQLCTEAKMSDESEVENLKRYAAKFTHLDGPSLVEEYLR